MLKHLAKLCIPLSLLLLMLPGSLILAQAAIPALAEADNDKALTSIKASEPQVAAVRMSPVGKESNTLTTADDLVREASNTAMVAGSCLVIDAFVRQFCTANPNDPGCQFQ